MKTVYNGGSAILWLLLIVVCSVMPARTRAQAGDVEPGSLKFLDAANGYNSLLLGADVRQMPEKYFSYLDNDASVDLDSCLKFKYTDTTMLQFEDGLKLDLVGLRSYDNRIVNVYLFFKIDDGFKMLKALQNYFGAPTEHPGDFMYDWTGDNVDLKLRFETKSDLGVAIISSKKIEREMNEATDLRRKKEGEAIIAAASTGSSPKENDAQSAGYQSIASATQTNP